MKIIKNLNSFYREFFVVIHVFVVCIAAPVACMFFGALSYLISLHVFQNRELAFIASCVSGVISIMYVFVKVMIASFQE